MSNHHNELTNLFPENSNAHAAFPTSRSLLHARNVECPAPATQSPPMKWSTRHASNLPSLRPVTVIIVNPDSLLPRHPPNVTQTIPSDLIVLVTPLFQLLPHQFLSHVISQKSDLAPRPLSNVKIDAFHGLRFTTNHKTDTQPQRLHPLPGAPMYR